MPSLQRLGTHGRGRPVPTDPIDWQKYRLGQTGGSSEVPPECVAKADTGSPDDMFLRLKVLEPSIPEEIFVQPTHALPDPPPVDEYGG